MVPTIISLVFDAISACGRGKISIMRYDGLSHKFLASPRKYQRFNDISYVLCYFVSTASLLIMAFCLRMVMTKMITEWFQAPIEFLKQVMSLFFGALSSQSPHFCAQLMPSFYMPNVLISQSFNIVWLAEANILSIELNDAVSFSWLPVAFNNISFHLIYVVSQNQFLWLIVYKSFLLIRK